MTSGQFQSFPLSSIVIDRAGRQRRDLDEDQIRMLADSIAKIGLIHPPVISRDGQLRVGERRVTAMKRLGWTHTPVQFVEDMDEHELQLLELEENVRRVELPWQDQCKAIERYHDLRKQENPQWLVKQTAEALGMSHNEAASKMQVAKELAGGNSRVVEAPKYSVARNIVARESERRRDSIINQVAIEAGAKTEDPAKTVPIGNYDFNEWQGYYDGPKFNFIHCDFPYGVNADNHAQGAAASMGGYEDSKAVYDKLLETLEWSMKNVVADSAHLMFWFSMDYYEETKSWLEQMGWRINPFPLIWFKSDNTGILPDPARGPRRVYETAFLGSRGDRKIVGAVSNVCAHPATKDIHMSEKPVGMLKHFFRMFVDEYSTVLDPTCGSASALKAALALKANTVLGLEKDKEFFTLASEKFFDEDLTISVPKGHNHIEAPCKRSFT